MFGPGETRERERETPILKTHEIPMKRKRISHARLGLVARVLSRTGQPRLTNLLNMILKR